MTEQWKKSSVLSRKIVDLSTALNTVLKALIDVERQRMENMKKTVEEISKRKNGE